MGQRDMPKQFTKAEIVANPMMTAIKKTDVRKYLLESRTDGTDWKTGKSVEGNQQDQGGRRIPRSHPVARAPQSAGWHGG